ncbi:hypothetical protein EKO04_006355 [Ascochyta lentis]|uniref:Uncharacterized protein n=1 Tax=Ascochyta lentis TaxID=205686 RepID=A0A8H7MD39_9PLEO|nr:hypothetical protein EKO04_006355 [Ascochyta lentis]
MDHSIPTLSEDELDPSALPHGGPDSGNVQSACYIFRLPREIRDWIYDQYVQVHGGYIYDPNFGKLTRADDGGKIELRIMRTCRRIWKEMEPLPMQRNKITFRSSSTSESSSRAGVLHATLHRMERAQWYKLCMIGSEFLTDDVRAKIGNEFPQFRPVVDGLKALGDQDIEHQIVFNENSKNSWGKAPSIYRDFLQRLFNIVSQHPDWATRSHKYAEMRRIDADFVASAPKPWSILQTQEVERIKDVLYPGQDWQQTAFMMPSDTYTSSAAALAINFFKSISATTRKSIRAVELVEDQAAVAYPECHTRGLISFCNENPELRIQRLVNIWKTVLPIVYRRNNFQGQTCLGRGRITEHVAEWLIEATSLPALGMPEGCFTLVLDADPLPVEAAQVFDEIIEDSAEQAAMDRSFPQELLDDERWLERRVGCDERLSLYFEGFPEAMQALTAGNEGIVRCNFDLSSRVDLEQTIQQHIGLTWGEWQEKRFQRLDEPGPPMPSEEYLRDNKCLDQWRLPVHLQSLD